MKKLKYALIYVLSLVLAVSLTVVGTIAFLQEEKGTVNVMTVGNVHIALHEYERAVNEDGTYKTTTVNGKESYVLQPFTQAKPLYPSTELDANGNLYNFGAGNWDSTMVRMSQVGSHGSMQVFDSKLAVDKFVTVENTGKSDAYVRVFVAFEAGSVPADKLFTSVINYSDFMTAEKVWTRNAIGITNIDGNNYYVFEYLYNGAAHVGGVHANGVLPAGDTTYVSLAQVYMHGTATNEDMEALDGNNNGTFDILTFAQAVQTAGFNNAATAFKAAFGDVENGYHPWIDEAPELPAVVDDAKSLDKALNAGNDVVLNEDLLFNASETTANSGYGATGISVKGTTLDGAGNSIGVNNWDTWDCAVNTTGGTVKNITINSGMRGIFMGSATADVYIDNVVIDGTVYTFNSDGGNKDYGVYISNSTLNGWTSHSDVHKEVVYTNCNFGEGQGYAFCRPYGPTTFVNCNFEEGFRIDTSKTSDIVFINCYYGDTLITADNAATLSDGTTTFFYNGLNGITIR